LKAEILAVGTELLLGDVVDTNSAYLSRQAAALGLSVTHRQTVGDNALRLAEAIRLALSRAQVVILCGGLGPTPDDLTKEVAAQVLGKPLRLHEDSLRRMEAYFEASGRVMTDNNRKQAWMPEGATVFDNHHGTAPGCAMEQNGQHVLLLPGPPSELIPMFEESAKPYLRPLCDGVLRSHTVRVFGMGESAAAALVKDLLESENPTVAPYAKAGEMYFRVTARAADEQQADALCRPTVEALTARLADAVYGVDVDSLEEALVRQLIAGRQTVATAESCTGGLVSERLTAVAGASGVFACGVCAYSGDVKHRILGVPQDVIDRTGTVSRETAAYMARGVRTLAQADFGVSVTGVAGPGPFEGKPAGTVYVAVSTARDTFVRRLNLTHRPDREYIRRVASSRALDMVRRASLGESPADRFFDSGETESL